MCSSRSNKLENSLFFSFLGLFFLKKNNNYTFVINFVEYLLLNACSVTTQLNDNIINVVYCCGVVRQYLSIHGRCVTIYLLTSAMCVSDVILKCTHYAFHTVWIVVARRPFFLTYPTSLFAFALILFKTSVDIWKFYLKTTKGKD